MQIIDLVMGLPMFKSTLNICEGCIFGKHSKTPYPTKPITHATEVIALVHTDVCRPMPSPSFGGALCFFLFIDDFSQFI